MTPEFNGPIPDPNADEQRWNVMPLFRRQTTKRFPSISWESSSQGNSSTLHLSIDSVLKPLVHHIRYADEKRKKKMVLLRLKSVWEILSNAYRHVAEYWATLWNKTGALGPRWSLWLWLIFSKLWRERGGPEGGCQSKWKWPGWAGPSDTLYRRRGIFNLGLRTTRYRHTHTQCA